MMEQTGKCPGCDGTGPLGESCRERACQKRGYYRIPNEYWERTHASADSVPDPLIGQRVGDFLVVDFIGAGGFGKVFLALQTPLLSLRGALKLIEFPTDNVVLIRALLQKFQGEAEALAQLSHPNIVRLLKYGMHGERPYLVMELVDGGCTLREEIYRRARKNEAFTHAELLSVFQQILHGLEAAHQRSIIHRDIKPENIMLQSVVGNPLYVRILDFGTAKFVETRADTHWPMGSPSYMAPEQVTLNNLGPWSDLYAVGIMAFEMLSGRRPFPGVTDNEILLKKTDEDYDPLEQIQDLGFHPVTLDFLRRALAREPANRFQNAMEFGEAFKAVLEAEQDNGAHHRPGSTVASGRELTALLDSRDLLEFMIGEESNGVLENGFDQDVRNDAPTQLTPEPVVEALLDAQARAEELSDEPVEKSDVEVLGVLSSDAERTVVGQPRTEPSGEADSTSETSKKRGVPVFLVALIAVLAVIVVAYISMQSASNALQDNAQPMLASGPAAIIASPASEATEGHEPEVEGALEEGALRAADVEGGDVLAQEDVESDVDLFVAHDADVLAEAEENAWTGNIAQVTLGKFHTCVRFRAGDVRCWGANHNGELGLGHKNSIGDREEAKAAPLVAIGGKALQIESAGDRHASFNCVLLEGGNVRCWGANHFGQLGYGNTERIGESNLPESAPFVSLGGPVKQLAVGAMQYASHACALLETGEVRCWGNNRYGQLGYGHTRTIGNAQVPTSVGVVSLGARAVQITAGKFHSCALLEDGNVRCWGSNQYGQLGSGTPGNIGDDEIPSSVPVVELGEAALQISAGRAHTCALLAGGRVRCWGWNSSGQLGYGSTDNVGLTNAPASAGDVEVGGAVRHISAGGLHTCALLENGNVRCWGDNKFGQLGYGHKRSVGMNETPRSMGDVYLGASVVALEAGNYHSCAILEDDTLRCWGLNSFGQLGYGHTRNIGETETPASAGAVPIF